jgi:hypothetical protein
MFKNRIKESNKIKIINSKRLVFIFLLSFIFNFSYSQHLTIKDLRFIYNSDDVSSNDYLLSKKGFILQSAKDETMDTVTYHVIEWSINYLNNNYTISKNKSKYEFNNKFVTYGFQKDTNLYIKLKDELRLSGYKSIKVENNEENSLEYTYSNGINIVRIVQYNPKSSKDENWYFISLIN